MKMRTLTLCVFVSFLTATSCKKDSNNPEPANTDPELLGPETSKILHYGFNGNLNDGSGNSLNAIESGNISYGADRLGRTNQAAVFGGPGNTSYVATPSLKSKNIQFPFAVSLWMRANNNTGQQTIIRADGAQTGVVNYTGFALQLGVTGAGSLAAGFGNGQSNGYGGRNTIITPNVIAPNQWYHVVVNFNAPNNIEIYINGIKNGDAYHDGTATEMVFANPESAGVMGVYGNGVPSEFGGMIDDYRIYKKTLTQAEISALYNFHL